MSENGDIHMMQKMLSTPLTDDHEAERLAELARRNILDTPPEVVFDRLTRLASKRFGMPIALVSLVDASRQWFKSKVGLEASETPRDIAFCAHAIQSDEVMVVHDAADDPRFAKNPLVIGDPNIRFYAGAPLVTRQGYALGTICVIDRKPHPEFGEEEKRELAELAAIAVDEMDLRQAIARTRGDLAALQQAQRELRETRDRAERVAQEKSQFIANISHELRTPMNGILGMAYLLADTQLDAVQREYINTINHSANNLLLLLNDVLDLSKIEAGELILEKTSFDIKHSFDQTIKLLKPLADKKNNRLETIIDERLPDIMVGDPVRFAQIITNLVGNAIKFTDHGVVEARLSYDARRSEVACEIIDNGIGIPRDKQADIFEKFVQGNAAITQKYGGTGLGLTITKQLVVMLGGEIGFDSTEGKGSRFWFCLPTSIPTQRKPLKRASANGDGFGKLPVAQARVLIAEDHPVNQLFLTKLLRKFGFTAIDLAENGVEVLAMAEAANHANQRAYDAIFMDCMMPEMDGYEATRRIRRLEAAAAGQHHVPVIAMTANALSGDREACFAAGMDEYLSKPLQPERLLQVLGQWFAFGSAAALNSGPDAVPEPSPTASPATPPIDFARITMVAEQPEDQRELLGLFFRLASDYTTAMHRARRDDEWVVWKNAAHSLKGTAANLGMQTLVGYCREAEMLATGGYAARSAILKKMEAEIEIIRAYVVAHHASLGMEF